MFIVRAHLRRIFEVPASIEQLCEFFSDPRSFARHMPIIEHITPVADSDDVTRWRFCVRVPIVAPITWEFVMYRRVNVATGEITYSAAEGSPDFFQCDVQVRPNPNGSTDADVRLSMCVWRPRARDIHPLAGLVGEQWIARVVTDRMDKMATAFVASGLREIQAKTEAQRAAAAAHGEETSSWSSEPAVAAPHVNSSRNVPDGDIWHAGCPAEHQPLTPSPVDAVPLTESEPAAEDIACVTAEGLSSNRTESNLETPVSGIVTP